MAVLRRLNALGALLVFICLVRTVPASCPDEAILGACSCLELVDGLQLTCSAHASIVNITSRLRAAGEEANVSRLFILAAPESVLESGTFVGFESLITLDLPLGNLRVIEPGAFAGLSQLSVLSLRGNQLTWLSAESLMGIGTELDILKLDGNQIQYLRRDLRPIFSTQRTITLDGNDLMCDCHLEWLATLARSSPPDVQDAECSTGVSIINALANFSQCSDPCESGFHNCHPNATCKWNQTSDGVTCDCNQGFTGNGFVCTAPLVPRSCNTTVCHPNASCSMDEATQQPVCMCDAGYVGDGSTCVSCSLTCVGEGKDCDVRGSTIYCFCKNEFVMVGEQCIEDDGSQDICPRESAAGYEWPATVVGTTVTLPCPNAGASVSRLCTTARSWGAVTAPDCVSEEILGLRNQLEELLADPTVALVMDKHLEMYTSQLHESVTVRNITFAGDIPQVVDIVQGIIDLLDGDTFIDLPVSYKHLVDVASELLDEDKHPLWLQLNESLVSEKTVNLLDGTDELGRIVLFQTSPNTTLTNISSENVAVLLLRPQCHENGSVSLESVSSRYLEDRPSIDSTLIFPDSLFTSTLGGRDFNCSEVGVVAVVSDGAGPLLSYDNSILPQCTPTEEPLANGKCMWSTATVCPEVQVNSLILSVIVVSNNENEAVNTSRLTDPVTIVLQYQDNMLTGPICAFINEEEGPESAWAEEGCRAIETREDRTVCECDHLTSFALLMSPSGEPSNDQPLLIASKVGLSLSIVCLLITISLLFGLRMKSSNKLYQIHRQLALALCLSQVVFLVGVDRTSVPSPDWLCTLIAFLLHYFLLCTFAWQLVEGVHLYLYVVKVFFNEKVKRLYYPLAWGTPVIIVAITLGIRFCDYGSEHYCWISTGNGTNWAFHGPVIGVLAVNIVILCIVSTVIAKATRRKEDNAGLFCTLLHASLVLLPILGITWVLGFLVVGDGVYSTVVEWLFFAFTTLQGVAIFFVHCVLNREVRAAFLKAIGCREAAKRQKSVMSHSRRMSKASIRPSESMQSFVKRSFTRARKDNYVVTDITSLQLDESIRNNITVARPDSGYDLQTLVDIQEEEESQFESSAPPSAVSTPKIG